MLIRQRHWHRQPIGKVGGEVADSLRLRWIAVWCWRGIAYYDHDDSMFINQTGDGVQRHLGHSGMQNGQRSSEQAKRVRNRDTCPAGARVEAKQTAGHIAGFSSRSIMCR